MIEPFALPESLAMLPQMANSENSRSLFETFHSLFQASGNELHQQVNMGGHHDKFRCAPDPGGYSKLNRLKNCLCYLRLFKMTNAAWMVKPGLEGLEDLVLQ